jgi:predicted glycosyltransferase
MRILVEMGHPKDVNLFKNIIRSLEEKGHVVKIAARNKETVFAKLDDHGFEYEPGSEHYKGLFFKAIGIPKVQLWLYRIAKKFNPDIFVGGNSMYSSYVSKLFRKPYICFSDVEKDFTFRLMMPFADVILLPSCFERELGAKEVRFNSYLELTYLHPNNFKPNPAVLNKLNLSEKDRFILMRISSLDAFHDIGAKGLSFNSSEELREFIQKLEVYGRVFLTSEIELSDEFDKYELKIPVNELQNCIYYSTMYIGDGASMAAEAAILGVPSIYVTNTRRWGFTNDLEKSYGLLYTFSNREQALEKAMELLEDEKLREKWQKKRDKMLSEKIDAAKFLIEFIERYERK